MTQRRMFGAATGLLLVAVATFVGVRWQAGGHARAQDGNTVTTEAFYGVSPSEEQLALLADGVVTEAELRQALERAADCLEAFGVQAVRSGHPQLEGNLVLGLFVPDGGDFAGAREALRTCEGLHSGQVSAAFAAQHPEIGAPPTK